MTDSRKDRIAVALFSFNRPDYLKEVLHSIENNTAISDLDFFLFQEGAVNAFSGRIAAKEEDIQSCLNCWNQSSLPNKHLFLNEYNLGIGINQFKAKVILFEELRYERVIFFEDDLVVSPHYIRLLRIMLDQFQDENNVGAVMCHGGHPRLRPEEERKRLAAMVHSGNHSLWGWGTWRNRWERIKPTFLNYYELIRYMDYRDRPSLEIMDLYAQENVKIGVTSQDAALHYAFIKNNFVILNTIIHRGRYIGERGEHMNPATYAKIGFANIRIEDFPADEEINCFEGYDPEKSIQSARSIFFPPAWRAR